MIRKGMSVKLRRRRRHYLTQKRIDSNKRFVSKQLSGGSGELKGELCRYSHACAIFFF
jgi:hypothetical protein